MHQRSLEIYPFLFNNVRTMHQSPVHIDDVLSKNSQKTYLDRPEKENTYQKRSDPSIKRIPMSQLEHKVHESSDDAAECYHKAEYTSGAKTGFGICCKTSHCRIVK